MNLSFPIRQRFFDSNGLPLAGGQLYTYQAGTTTPQATYSNQGGTTNTNPVVLDSQGYCDLWLDPTLAYKFILQDSNSNVQWTIDNVQYYAGITTWNANTTYSQYQLAIDPNSGMEYVSLINNNTNNALTNVSAWRAQGGNIRTVSVGVTLTVTDDVVLSNSTSGNLTQTLPPCSTTIVGKKLLVKDIGTGGNYTQVKGSNSDLIDGNNTYNSNLTQYIWIIVQNTGTYWAVIG